jgi:CheY-like chemotaxis protein
MPDHPAILYVEDDAMCRAVMEIVLTQQMGLTSVAMFDDSSNFMARLEQLPFQPNIVLLDIHIGPLNGFEMLNHLRALPHYANKPIAALTASVMSEEIARLRVAGFTGVIPKPIDIDVFPEIIARLMSGQSYWGLPGRVEKHK